MDNQVSANVELTTIGFVLSVLKQHEKEFDRLIFKLSEITEQLRETDKVLSRIEEIDRKLESLRTEVSNIAKCRFESKSNRGRVDEG
jgi:chaperonin cofactor prefoldin